MAGKAFTLSAAEKKSITSAVQQYVDNKKLVFLFQKSIVDAFSESAELRPLIHSIKSRLKDPHHLREKLERKVKQGRDGGVEYEIPIEDLLKKITDLAGVRILHLYTKQFKEIDLAVKRIFEDMNIQLTEGPFARTWDDESRHYFATIGIEAQDSPTMYTSVHYVVASNSKTCVTCEIQVRTLMEEVWGEVDHTINYPKKIEDVACSEQIRALARSTSSTTRLVDSIFASVGDFYHRQSQVKMPTQKKKSKAASLKK